MPGLFQEKGLIQKRTKLRSKGDVKNMLASELAKMILDKVEKVGDKEVAISVAFSNKLISSFEDIELVDYGSYLDVRGKQ